jgi:hypothetical protein
MKAQGTDGYSRGNLKEGVAAGRAMLSFIPLQLGEVERSPKLVDWVRSWFQEKEVELLEPEDWFERGHDLKGGSYDPQGFWRPVVKPGVLLWSPPPGAAKAAIEELRKARVRGPSTPRAGMAQTSSKSLIEIPPGHLCWPCVMFEPLIIGVCLPFIRSDPWQLKGTPKVFAMVRNIQNHGNEGRDILCEYLLEFERVHSMPADVMRKILYFGPSSEVPC